MPREQKSAARSRFYKGIGKSGWRGSGYTTTSYFSPAFRQWIASQLPGEPMDILSIGCGGGELEAHLAEAHRVLGLDLSHPMLRRASRRGLEWLVQADGRSLPFGPAQFDVVIIPESIGYFALDQAFGEARRVLKKRGRLLVTTYAAPVATHAGYRKWGLGEIAKGLTDAGFRVAERRYLEVTRNRVRDVAAEAEATLLYLSSVLKR